ncbi:MAG: TraB/GumN family protein [Methanomicrobiales archaeon]
MNPESLEIIGTAHVSKKSMEEVRETILEKKPDVVAVELCPNRYNSLMKEKYGDPDEDKKKIPLREMIKGDKLTLFLVSGFLSYIQRKIGDEVGVKPGSEMLVAIEAAEEVGSRVALIDRDITITLKRALNQMSFLEKLKFVYGIIGSFFSKEEELEKIDSITQGDTLKEVMEYFQSMSPQAYEVLVTERDAFMAKMLLGIEEENVIAVVGAGHKQGITKYLKNPQDIPPMQQLMSIKKSKFPISKLIVYSIPVIFIGIFIMALIQGINIQGGLLQFILLTGGLAFLGSILTGSKIYSALTAFAVAPITSIHPLLAAGWFAGLVEAKLRKVNSEDFSDITKCDSFKELMKNNLFRVLLVVVGANIGCSIGTLISIPNVIFPLFSKIIGG